jgi:hypothetical protein
VPQSLADKNAQANQMDERVCGRPAGAIAWVGWIQRKPVAGLWLAVVSVAGAIAIAALLGALATPSIPPSLQIEGYVGHLGEWELTAALSRHEAHTDSDLAGPMMIKHVGFCSKDGPEIKTGAMKIRRSRLSSSIDVKLQIDGVWCTHSGDLSDAYIGTMVCPDRKAVPLTLWKK